MTVQTPSLALHILASSILPALLFLSPRLGAPLTPFFFFFLFFKDFFNVFVLFLRERERDRQTERQNTSGRRAEREGDTESKARSRLQAISTEPDVGLEPTDHDIVT